MASKSKQLAMWRHSYSRTYWLVVFSEFQLLSDTFWIVRHDPWHNIAVAKHNIDIIETVWIEAVIIEMPLNVVVIEYGFH